MRLEILQITHFSRESQISFSHKEFKTKKIGKPNEKMSWLFRIRLYIQIPTLLTFFSACLIWYQTQYHNLTQSDKSIIKRYVIMIQTSFGTFKFGGKWERSAYTSNHWLEANDWRIGLSIYLEEEEKHIWICCYYYYCWCVQVWTV